MTTHQYGTVEQIAEVLREHRDDVDASFKGVVEDIVNGPGLYTNVERVQYVRNALAAAELVLGERKAA